MNSPICLPGSVLAKVDDLAGATEPTVVVHAESKKKQTNKNWVVSNMCFALTVNLEKLTTTNTVNFAFSQLQ